tara:strand:+ start:792 stop:1265 length:474 start_codon:yes stop_codon:yes gene_type:complete
MVNYNQSNIYKLCCKDENITECYVGSTTNFKRRYLQHKCRSYNINELSYSSKLYSFIRNNGGFDNWTMKLLENVNCDTKLELHKLERKWIENSNAILNCRVPTRTKKEFYQDNKARLCAYKNIKFECDVCLGSYTRNNFAKHKKTQKHVKHLLKNIT